MRELSEPRVGSMWWFFRRNLIVSVWNLKYEGALGTESWFDMVVLSKNQTFLVQNLK